MKTVYTCFCTDVIHDGHLNIIREAKKRGRIPRMVHSPGSFLFDEQRYAAARGFIR